MTDLSGETEPERAGSSHTLDDSGYTFDSSGLGWLVFVGGVSSGILLCFDLLKSGVTGGVSRGMLLDFDLLKGGVMGGVSRGMLLDFDLLKGGVRVKGLTPFTFATLAEETVGVKGRMPVGS